MSASELPGLVELSVSLPVPGHQVLPNPPLVPAPQSAQAGTGSEPGGGRYGDADRQEKDPGDQLDQPPLVSLGDGGRYRRRAAHRALYASSPDRYMGWAPRSRHGHAASRAA